MVIYYSLFYPLLHFAFAIGLSALILFAYFFIGRIPELFESCFILVLIIRGFLFLKIPYFIISKKGLIIYNRLGGKQKHYKYSSLKDIQIENQSLYLKQSSKAKKIRISKIFINSNNWDKLISHLKSEDITKELH